ncbi:hypothetical protein [Pseudanabaena sp. PCC 6802]|nr:hypothetical protein [Pseudanabaena sp. PCC 6802]
MLPNFLGIAIAAVFIQEYHRSDRITVSVQSDRRFPKLTDLLETSDRR